MVFKDYYKILGLETSKVSVDEIKIAYRTQAKKFHPDLNVGDKTAENKIKDINEAYTKLSNPAEKRKYDRIWNSHFGRTRNGKNKIEKDYIFNMFLGNTSKNIDNKNKTPINGENIETEINITLEEAFFGKEKTIVLKNNEGKDKTYTFKIPIGIKSGEKLRLIEQGKIGKNGGKNGDLLIQLNMIENDKFSLKGDDLHTILAISPWESILGKEVEIATIDGMVKVELPKGIQSGEEIEVPSKGYIKQNGERGNLYAEIRIMVPQKLNEDEAKLFQKLEKVSEFNPRS